jgi:phospholipid/cholesterol/gamma-HCH transport system substrate-binding protein
MSAGQPPIDDHGERGLRDQIERYRVAFVSVVTMIVVALLVGGYILAHERLSLPSWVPGLGSSYVTLKADFHTAQAVTAGQGQAVTIAGAKVGEIASVEVHEGSARVSMNIEPKYARYIYHDATMLLRPKTQLKDMTVEIDPGDPSSGAIKSGYVVPQAQTAPDVNFEEFLSSVDAETRTYLQELLAGAGEGLKGNSANLSAAFKRFDPIARISTKLAHALQFRQKNIERSVHNFQLILSALGNKDDEISQLVDASNAVFQTFSEQDRSVERTLHLLPGTLTKTRNGLGKLATAAKVTGTTLQALEPFAKALAPANAAAAKSFEETTPVIKNEIRPFAREVVPVVNQIGPSIKQLGQAFPDLQNSFSVLNEFFNEIAYNPGPKQGGFMFFLGWANHNLNSVLSTAEAHGPIGRTVSYLNCEVLPLLNGIATINPTVKLLVALFKPPSGEECVNLGLKTRAELEALGGLPPAGGAATTGTATTGTATTSAAAARKRTSTAAKGFQMKLLGTKDSSFFGHLASVGQEGGR